MSYTAHFLTSWYIITFVLSTCMWVTYICLTLILCISKFVWYFSMLSTTNDNIKNYWQKNCNSSINAIINTLLVSTNILKFFSVWCKMCYKLKKLYINHVSKQDDNLLWYKQQIYLISFHKIHKWQSIHSR